MTYKKFLRAVPLACLPFVASTFLAVAQVQIVPDIGQTDTCTVAISGVTGGASYQYSNPIDITAQVEFHGSNPSEVGTAAVYLDTTSDTVCSFSFHGSAPPACSKNLAGTQVGTHELFWTCNNGASNPAPNGTEPSFLVYNAGTIYPKYRVESIVYAPPGNHSNNSFTDALTDGTTTGIGSSFSNTTSVTFSIGLNFLGVGSTASWTTGQTNTKGFTETTTQTISEATGVGLSSNAQSPNTSSHTGDLFVIWTNPAVEIYQTGPKSIEYGLGTQLQTAGDPNPGTPETISVDQEVQAGAMQNGGVPIGALNPVSLDGQTLPGLGNICASTEYYPNSCTQQNQCGCTATDFAGILAMDPLLRYPATESPLDANGSISCTGNPTSTSNCRYVPELNSENAPVSVLLAGPQEPGGPSPITPLALTDTNQIATTQTTTTGTTVGFTWAKNFNPGGNGPTITTGTSFTWSNSQSSGEVNGSAHTMQGQLSSSTLDCYDYINVFEDTVFHTYVFQMTAPDNTSCP